MHRQLGDKDVWGVSPLENKKLVANTNKVGRRKVHSSAQCKQEIIPSLGPNRKTPNVQKTDNDFYEFVSSLFTMHWNVSQSG